MPPSHPLAAHVFPTLRVSPETCLAILKIDSILGNRPIHSLSGETTEKNTTEISPLENWLVGEQKYVEHWNAVSRGLTILSREPTLLNHYKATDYDNTKPTPLGDPNAFHTEPPHHTPRQNNHSNTVDPSQLGGRKRDNGIPQSNADREIHPGVDLVISTSPTSCDDKIFDVETIEFGKGVPRDGQSPDQCSGSKLNLSLQNPRSRGCRKRLFEPGDDEEPSEPPKGDGEPNRNNNGPLTRRKCQRYACPYYLNDPDDSKYRSGEELVKCRTEGVEASKLKEHIRRKHTKPEQCAICGFRGEHGILRKHQQKVSCSVPEGGFEKVDADTLAKDKLLKPKNQSWSQVFKILFPGRPVPDSKFVPPVVSQGFKAPACCNQSHSNASDIYWQHFRNWLVVNTLEVHRMFQESPDYIRFVDSMKGLSGDAEAVEMLLVAGNGEPAEVDTEIPGTGLQEGTCQLSTINLNDVGSISGSQFNLVHLAQRRPSALDQPLPRGPPSKVLVGTDTCLGLSTSTPDLSDDPSRCASISGYLESGPLRLPSNSSSEEDSPYFFREAFYPETENKTVNKSAEQNPSSDSQSLSNPDSAEWNLCSWLPLTENPRSTVAEQAS